MYSTYTVHVPVKHSKSQCQTGLHGHSGGTLALPSMIFQSHICAVSYENAAQDGHMVTIQQAYCTKFYGLSFGVQQGELYISLFS